MAIGEGKERLTTHPLRAAILAELHARPFTPVEAPRRILHFAFDTTGDHGAADRTAILGFCEALGFDPPRAQDKHHRIAVEDAALRWEQHSEFATYTWSLPAKHGLPQLEPFQPGARLLAAPMGLLPQPGPLLVAIDLHLVKDHGVIFPDKIFDHASLAMAETGDGAALIASDFSAADGFIRILVLDRGLSPERAGVLVQRVLELETYRTIALLGLPEAQRLGPSISQIERRLAGLTDEMQRTEGLEANQRLLHELTALAAELEAGAAASLFRFGASRAYYEIVQSRLQTIGERAISGYPTWSSFLGRRMAPAMRTCASTEDRQANLSAKLARAAQLLRTRVDIELQQQNRDLLTSMNDRTRLQLHLQRTVEGLSVAAISYYVVGLFGYLVKGAKDAGAPVDPSLATAMFVPVAVAAIWWIVRRIRRGLTDRAGK